MQGHSFIEEGKFGDWEEEETMIGADTGAFPGEVSFVVGSVSSFDMSISGALFVLSGAGACWACSFGVNKRTH